MWGVAIEPGSGQQKLEVALEEALTAWRDALIANLSITANTHPQLSSQPISVDTPITSIMFAARNAFAQAQRRAFSASARQVRCLYFHPNISHARPPRSSEAVCSPAFCCWIAAATAAIEMPCADMTIYSPPRSPSSVPPAVSASRSRCSSS